MGMKRHLIQRAIYFLGLFLIMTACEIPSQKPSQIFQNGKWPELLENLANPKPPKSLYTWQYNKNHSSVPYLGVGVIDLGVDYLHPQLMGQVRYDIDENKQEIIGAGYDIMGEDSWAHPSVVEPSLFAFGAEAVGEDGRIINPVADPLALLNKLNEGYAEIALPLILNDKRLEGTIWQKQIQKNALTIFAGYFMAHLEDSDDPELKEHNEKKEQGLLLNLKDLERLYAYAKLNEKKNAHLLVEDGPSLLKELEEMKIQLKKEKNLWNFITNVAANTSMSTGFYRGLLKHPLTSSADYYFPIIGGLDDSFTFGIYLEGYEILLEDLKEAFLKYSEAEKFKSSFLNYVAYYKFISQRESKDINIQIDRLGVLYTSFMKIKTQMRSADPLSKRVRSFCNNMSEETYNFLNNYVVSNEEKDIYVFNMLEKRFSYFNFINDQIVNNKIPVKEEISTDMMGNDEKLEVFSRYWAEISKHKGLKPFTCQLTSASFDSYYYPIFKDDALMKNFWRERRGPYIHPTSSEKSHGSHVAGIIARQDKNIEIIPVRVLTEGIEREQDIIKAQRARTLVRINEWMKENTYVIKAIASLLDKAYPELKNIADLDQTRIRIMELFKTAYDINFFNNKKFDIYFIDEVIKSIDSMGEHKIKIANVSLGTEEEIPVEKSDGEKNLKRKLTQTLGFVLFEYFKFSISDHLVKKAPGTLFVIAAGNSGKWVDGFSHSAIPCDMTSTLLKKFANTKAGDYLPNENVQNILCVGSINSEQHLSSYTNVVLGNIPFVFARGESIYSAVNSKSCDGVEQQINNVDFKEQGSLELPPIDLDGGNLTKDLVMKGLEKLVASGKNPEALNRFQALSEEQKKIFIKSEAKRMKGAGDFIKSLKDIYSNDACARDKRHMATMSGTSMASPGVAGYVGHFVLEKMREHKINKDKEIYLNENFMPARIIEDIQKDLPMFSCDRLKGVCMIGNLKEYRSKNDIDDLKPELFFLKKMK